MERKGALRIIYTLPTQGEPSESKAMGPCLEADYKPPAVERPPEYYCLHSASTKEVVEPVRSGAFASPGSPVVYTCRRFSSDHA
jgi:hypothetical protein